MTASRTRAAVVGRSARTASEPAWPGQIDADEDVVLRQEVAEGSPQARRLGEAVQQDHRRTGARAALFDMEWHAW